MLAASTMSRGRLVTGASLPRRGRQWVQRSGAHGQAVRLAAGIADVRQLQVDARFIVNLELTA